jgi:hypothetical protein
MNVVGPPESHNGNGRVQATIVGDVRHRGLAKRVAYWLVDVAVPKLLPDHVTAHLRRRLRSADDRLERTARRLTRHRFDAARTNRGGDAR